MKKIFALLLVLILPLVVLMVTSTEESLLAQVEEKGYSKKGKNLKWEFIKDRLFEGKVNRLYTHAEKFKGPILVELENATCFDPYKTRVIF